MKIYKVRYSVLLERYGLFLGFMFASILFYKMNDSYFSYSMTVIALMFLISIIFDFFASLTISEKGIRIKTLLKTKEFLFNDIKGISIEVAEKGGDFSVKFNKLVLECKNGDKKNITKYLNKKAYINLYSVVTYLFDYNEQYKLLYKYEKLHTSLFTILNVILTIIIIWITINN